VRQFHRSTSVSNICKKPLFHKTKPDALQRLTESTRPFRSFVEDDLAFTLVKKNMWRRRSFKICVTQKNMELQSIVLHHIWHIHIANLDNMLFLGW
jgi:hypothetical protein